MSNEPILMDDADKSRFNIFPIKYNDVWAMAKKAEASIWRTPEVDLSGDLNDWDNKLNDNERHFIAMVLAFFSASDGIVNENLAMRMYNDVKIAEARHFYGIQIMMEHIHAEMYGLLIEAYIRNNTGYKHKLFNAVEHFPAIQKKAKWAMLWINNPSATFAQRLIAFSAVEGIFFSGSFCAIFWLKKRGLMPGLCKSNEWISRDEGLHTDFACLLFKMLINKPSQDLVHQIIREAVSIESEFVSSALPVSLIGMNANMMITYIQFVGDRLLYALGYDKIWKVKNPFEWMEMISLQGKTNFFENRVSEYSLVSDTFKKSDFDMDTDF